MEQKILTDIQEKAISLVANEPNLSGFYLTGGTALAAYYLKHRLSNDLDFFSFEDPEMTFLHAFAEKIKDAVHADSARFERLYDRNQFFFKIDSDELKIEFTKYPFKQLEKPEINNNIKVDSLRDISANKLMALLDRFDPKDFVDLRFILKKANLLDIRKDAEKKFGVEIDDIFLGGELAKVKKIESLPKMIKNITIKELKEFFSKEAKEIKSGIFE